jgi:hypothetical protein
MGVLTGRNSFAGAALRAAGVVGGPERVKKASTFFGENFLRWYSARFALVRGDSGRAGAGREESQKAGVGVNAHGRQTTRNTIQKGKST